MAEVLSSFSHNITEIQTSLGSLSSELGKDRDQVHEDRRSVALAFLWVRAGRTLACEAGGFLPVLAGVLGRGTVLGAGRGGPEAGREESRASGPVPICEFGE